MRSTKQTRVRRWRRPLFSLLLRRRGDPAPAVPAELAPTTCFGALGEPQKLVLEDFVPGDATVVYDSE